MKRSAITQFASFIACVWIVSCVATSYPAAEWRLGAGEQLTFPAPTDWTLDVVRLVIPESGTYELSLDCDRVELRLYEDEALQRTWQGTGIEVEMTISSNYQLALDRAGQPDCRGPLLFNLVGEGAEIDADSDIDAGSDSVSDPGDGLGVPAELACSADTQCNADEWCSTVPEFRACAPRLFAGTPNQMDFVIVPSGTFQQGTPGATNEERPYTATISRDYFVSRTEVTQGQWRAATGRTNPSCFQSTSGPCMTGNANDGGPVESLDWYSTLAFANWLSIDQGLSACYTLTPFTCADTVSDWGDGDTDCTGGTFTGLSCTGYRLLTESEWERAARGGTTSTYYWGEAAETGTVERYAWFISNSASRTRAVGDKQSNAYGLFDMSGNVYEFVWDWVYASDWGSYPSPGATDYSGLSTGSTRGIRGGDWSDGASLLRSADRSGVGPAQRVNDVGFRLARTAN